MEADKVRILLSRFQEGYSNRDQSHLDEFMELFIDGDELEVIGTNAVDLSGEEWCQGKEAVRALVGGDWEHWGDVRFDMEGAHIHVRGEVAWIATTGTVKDTISTKDRYAGFLDYVEGVLQDEELNKQAKMLGIVRLGNDLALDLPLSETYVWPFRLTAVAVQDGDEWRFHQMHFSFATTRAPDVRL
jgi:hypothetical protein